MDQKSPSIEPLLKESSISENSESKYNSPLSNLISEIGFNNQLLIVFIINSLAQMTIGIETFFQFLDFEKIASFQGLSINLATFCIFCTYNSYAIGNIIVGNLGQNFGRTNLIIYSSLFYFIGVCLCSIFPNFYYIIVFRTLGDFILSGVINPTNLLLTEYLPVKNRGLYLMISSSFYNIGILLVIINNLIFSNQGSYEIKFRYCNFFNGMPAFTIFILSYFFLNESAIFLLSKGKQDEAFDLIKNMISTSKSKINLSERKKIELISEVKLKKCNTLVSSYKELFRKEYFKLSILILIINGFANIGNIAITYLVPKTLELIQYQSIFPENYGLLIFGLIQFPFSVIGGYLSELKSLGRLKTNFLCSFLSMILTIFILFQINYISIIGGFVTILTYINVSLVFIYIEESYPTKIRDNATALNMFLSNFITSIIPYLINFSPSLNTSFIILIFIFLIITLLILLLPFETRKRPLDYEEIDNEMK